MPSFSDPMIDDIRLNTSSAANSLNDIEFIVEQEIEEIVNGSTVASTGAFVLYDFTDSVLNMLYWNIRLIDNSGASNLCKFYFDPDTGSNEVFFEIFLQANEVYDSQIVLPYKWVAPGVGDMEISSVGSIDLSFNLWGKVVV